MFRPGPRRAISALVLVTFTSLTLQPLTAAAQLPSAAKGAAQPQLPPTRAAAQPPTAEERYSRTLAEIHDILKEIAPRSAMPYMFRPGKDVRAVGPKMRVETERDKPLPGVDVAAKVRVLRAKFKELKALDEDLDKGFSAAGRDLKQKNLPAEILTRHDVAVAEYQKRRAEFVSLAQAVERAAENPEDLSGALAALGDLMARYPSTRAQSPADPTNLPFGAARPLKRAPYTSPAQFRTGGLFGELVKVAQVGSLSGVILPNATLPATPTAADTAPTQDAPITPAIRALANSLGNNPVKIYSWVRNNIEFIPTYGSIQGADLALQTKRANAFDTASLLVALLRAANIPARYVYGTVEIPADQVMNWVGGMTAPQAAISFMGKGGIPAIGVAQAGQVKWVRLEHMWVEAFVDYVPSRGAVNRSPNTWVPLDASFKQYSVIPSLIPPEFSADVQSLASGYLQSAIRSPGGASETGFDESLLNAPIQAMKDRMATLTQANPDKVSLDDFIGGRSIAVSEPAILAGTLPYKVVATGAKMSALPDNLRVAALVELYAADPLGDEGSPLFSRLISLPSLNYGSLTLSHVAATAQDDAVWSSYAGAQSFPAYLVHVKSRLALEGLTMAESDAITLGQDLKLKVSFQGAGFSRSVAFDIVAGDEIQLGINGAGQSPVQGFALQERTDLGTAAGNLYLAAKVFWTQEDFQQKLLGALHRVASTRLPSVGIFASPISVAYSFGIARQASYHSRQVDVKLSNIAAEALDGNPRTTNTFALHAGIVGSSTEGAVMEEVFSKRFGHGSNTARLLQLANQQHIPIYHLTVDNIAANRSALQHAPEVMADIDNALAAGLEVIIPQFRQTNGTWTGSGYIMMDPLTASADYRVSGGLSGNIDDEACQRQTQPVRVVLPDSSLIWLILLGWMIDDDFNFNGAGVAAAVVMILTVVVLVSIIAAPAITVAATAVGTFARAAITATLLAMSGTAAAEEGGDECSCAWTDIPRRGGFSAFTQVHNMCADRFTDIPGRDIKLRGVAFDGIRQLEFPPNGTLYEIKTGLFYSTIKAFVTTRPKLQGFLDALKAKAIAGYFREKIPAALCNYEFRYGTRDPALMADMQTFFAEVGLPSDAARVFGSNCPP